MIHDINEEEWNPDDYQGKTYKQYQDSLKQGTMAIGAIVFLGFLAIVYWILTMAGIAA